MTPPRYAPAVEAELARLINGTDPDWIEEDEAALYAPAADLDPAGVRLLEAAIALHEQSERDAYAATQRRTADALADVDAWHGVRR